MTCFLSYADCFAFKDKKVERAIRRREGGQVRRLNIIKVHYEHA
jgi:hypothetical protein